jgi:hypothetical protein
MDKPPFIFLFSPSNVPYAESFVDEAQEIVSAAFKAMGV